MTREDRARIVEAFREAEALRAIGESGNRVIGKSERPAIVRAEIVEIRHQELNREIGESGNREIGRPCKWRRMTGERCERPAVEGREECVLHGMWYEVVPADLGLPYPEDATSVRHLLARAVSLVMAGRLTPAQGQAVAALCREMLKVVPGRWSLVAGR